MSNDDGAARRRARTCVLFGRIDQHLWLQQQVYVKRFVQHDQNGDREQLVERVVVVEMGDVVISLLHDFLEPRGVLLLGRGTVSPRVRGHIELRVGCRSVVSNCAR